MKLPKTIDKWVDANLGRLGYKKTSMKDTPRDFRTNSVRPVFLKLKPDIVDRNADIEEQEYDFHMIRKALDVESIIRQAREKYIQLMWKNGYSIVGKNDKAVKYIKQRFQQMSLVTGVPTDKFFREISEELIPYHNVYIVKQRDIISSGGSPYINVFGRRVQPIAGLFILPASHVKPVTEETNKRLVGWEIEDFKDLDDQFHRKEDVFHIYMNKGSGYYQGSPSWIPVLDDIRALRKMEENAEALVYQHAIPLIEYKIGTEANPSDQPEEFDAIKTQIQNMDAQGMFVVPYDHKITAIGNGSSPLDVEKYLRYFRLRVISGLGLSTIAFGEADSANRNTASVMDRGLQDGAKEYIAHIKMFFNEMIIKELLQEGGYDIMDPKNAVTLWIPEIDVDSKLAKETHTMALFHGNCITEDEMREDLGRESITDQMRAVMYWNLVEAPRALIGSGDERFTQEGTHGHPSASKNGLKIDPKTANKVRPQNQNGTKINTKPAVNASIADTTMDHTTRGLYHILTTEYDSLMKNVTKHMTSSDNPESPKTVVQQGIVSAYDKTYELLAGSFLQGFSANSNDKWENPDMTALSTIAVHYQKFLQRVGVDATILLEELQGEKIVSNTSDNERFINSIKGSDIITVFDSLRPRLAATVPVVIRKAYNLGKAMAIGKDKSLKMVDKAEKCAYHGKIVKANLDTIPPHDPNCQCKIEPSEES